MYHDGLHPDLRNGLDFHPQPSPSKSAEPWAFNDPFL